MLEKITKFLDDVGPFGGIGALLLLASWALAITDLTTFDLTRLKSMSPVQLIATVLAIVGLLSMLYQLKRAKAVADIGEKVSDNDMQRWEALISFLQDRRYLYSVMEYEHLPMMTRSIADTREYIRDQLQTLEKRSSLRGLFEELQSACREFDDTMTRIDLSIRDTMKEGHDDYHRAYTKLGCDASLKFPEGVTYVGDIYPPVYQHFFITSVGILRGKFASALEHYGTGQLTGPRWKSLTVRFGGSNRETI
jgi:hypothetical protein